MSALHKIYFPLALLLAQSSIASAHNKMNAFDSISNKKNGFIKMSGPASPLPVEDRKRIKLIPADFSDWITISQPTIEAEEKDMEELVQIENSHYDVGNKQKILLRLLRTMKVKKAFSNKKYNARILNDLATISARLKLYPLAMGYQFEAMQLEDTVSNNDLYPEETLLIDQQQTGHDSLQNTIIATVSEKVSAKDIMASYEDGKTASEYALILHVQQPLAGKRKSFTGINNVGHMFITLIKYNDDRSYVSRSFGFYPDKNSFFSATPFHPTATPVFKDDGSHDWDEAIGKFISYKRFRKIIRLLTKYECKMYNLNQNNCTDFGLTIASLSGININDTKGTWPLGKGNNPANAGQSILEGKLTNSDALSDGQLIIFNSDHLFGD